MAECHKVGRIPFGFVWICVTHNKPFQECELAAVKAENGRMREAVRVAIVYTNVEKRPGKRLTLIRETLEAALTPKPEQEKKPSEKPDTKGHRWERLAQDDYDHCGICGYVRRHDDGNKPCRGPVSIGLREKPQAREGDDGV